MTPPFIFCSFLATLLFSVFFVPIELMGQIRKVDQSEFQKAIRTTEPLTPQQERLRFQLPPGFDVQLVAAEPDIAKPMNMAFDARGRLWVTTTVEYPIPAKPGTKARDSIIILEDTNGDGRADLVKTFATGLNIPLGIMPYQDGALCYSIPNIWFLHDTDGDDKADKKEVLYGPVGYERDTHGMCNSFTRGYDGWLYATHGFNNHTELAGKDGHAISMKSGNIFRMRFNGDRVEHYSHGLVNPFGMTFDAAGDLFVADCHTKPISLILREGYYQSFGKPDDGLGYVPDVMQHLHNSTAIAGLAISEGSGFPSEYDRNTFGGNVMTSRINRDQLQRIGSSIRAVEKPDFLTANDPWFRPVDLKFGPDGALYVADFYNRIIGHYEVPLDHPGRDRFRGRIWRIVYRGTDKSSTEKTGPPPANSTNFEAMSLDALCTELAGHSRVRRMMAADRIVDSFGKRAEEPVRSLLRASEHPTARFHALWILNRLHQLEFADLSKAADDSHPEVREHVYRVLSEYVAGQNEPIALLLKKGMSDQSPLVQRAAVQASAVHRREECIDVLLKRFHSTDPQDVHLRHVIKIALRDHFLNAQWYRKTVASISQADIPLVAGISLALKNESAGRFIVENLAVLNDCEPERMSTYITFASQYVSPELVDRLVQEIRTRYQQDLEFQRVQMFSVKNGLAKRNRKQPASVTDWATALANKLLKNAEGPYPLEWSYLPATSAPHQPNPWKVTRRRASDDGQQNVPLYSSLPGGERAVGTYRSGKFVLQPEFSFYLCGHDGYPGKPNRNLNFVKLRDTRTHKIIQTWQPPRQDIARQFIWKTGDRAGSEVVVELVDGNNEPAFAWLAAGRFSEPRLNPSPIARQTEQAIEIIDTFGLHSFQKQLVHLLQSGKMNRHLSAMTATTIVKMAPDARLIALAASLEMDLDVALRKKIISAIARHRSAQTKELMTQVMHSASFQEQVVLADLLVSDNAGLLLLLELFETGKASARLLVQSELAQKLASLTNEKQKEKLAKIVNSLPKEEERISRLIDSRKQSYAKLGGDIQAGKILYEKNCSVCHQMGGKGKQVGPNLDGIGNRGLDRLCEDILAPNRNVDVAFRSSTILTEEGKIFVGLLKKSEGEQWILIDNKGNAIQIAEQRIDEHRKSLLSPMPANLGESLKDKQFRDLLAYLLSTSSSR